MEDVAAGLGRQRLLQQPAGRQGRPAFTRIAAISKFLRDCSSFQALAPGAQPLEPERVVALGVADVATGMAIALLQEDRLDAGLEELAIERWRRARRHLGNGEAAVSKAAVMMHLVRQAAIANPPGGF